MKLLLAFVGLLMLGAAPAMAEPEEFQCNTAAAVPPVGSNCPAGYKFPLPVTTGGGAPLGYQQITSLSSAVGLTVPSGAGHAAVVCTGQTVFWRDDGTAPTATVGMPLLVNTTLVVYSFSIAKIQFIQASASASCNVSYYQ